MTPSLPSAPSLPKAPGVGQCLIAIARHYGLLLTDLVGPKRDPRHIWPRALLCWLLHNRAGMDKTDIARELNRSYGSIDHAITSVDCDIATSTQRAAAADAIIKAL
jgi:chromosomal replication initiation ATPase DnaA